MDEKTTRKILQRLISPYLGELYFPYGVYGGTVYFLDEDGFYESVNIADHVVPRCFSKKALSKFNRKLKKNKKDVNNIRDNEIEDLIKGIDLRYGDGWELEPEDFVDMVKSGCDADTYYLHDDSNGYDYEDFFSWIEENIRECNDFIEWNDLALEDIEDWCETLVNTRDAEGDD